MGVSKKQLQRAKFWRKFLRLTRGRVPVLRALSVISEEETDSAFRKRIDEIRRAMDRGHTLSEAIGKFRRDFSPSIVELVKTAEKTGAWDEILQEIADGLQDGTFA
jgi:type II secretory pathway component PulF